MRLVIFGLLALSLSACADMAFTQHVVSERDFDCVTPLFGLDDNFPNAGMSSCRTIDDNTIEIRIRPEDTPINKSPWYAVRLTPLTSSSQNANLTLVYEEHPHRYRPKISSDGMHWSYIGEVAVSEDGYRVELDVRLSDIAVYVMAQELLTNAQHSTWLKQLSLQSDVQTIGRSIEERPIELLHHKATGPKSGRNSVLLVGRQHPPELTGALAMRAFVDELFNETFLSQRFRDSFDIYVVPNMNPDGVEDGHWRHNLGHTDLNRDWGPFTQPETQAVASVIDALVASGKKIDVFLDFHSTYRDVFYTQPVGQDGTDYGFTAQWLERAGLRLAPYELERAERRTSALATSKNYMNKRFDIPAITYEVGGETDRQQLAQAAKVLAQEMMHLLLEHQDD